jgi:hypothetical protein
MRDDEMVTLFPQQGGRDNGRRRGQVHGPRRRRPKRELQHVRLAYHPPVNSTFLSQQTSHQQPASSTFLSEQTSTSHQPTGNRTCSLTGC